MPADLLDCRSPKELTRIRFEIEEALSYARAAGAKLEIIGSADPANLQEQCDLDFRLVDRGSLSDLEVVDLVSAIIRADSFDVIFC